MLQTAKYVRKPFAVEAVEVTPENIHEVAEWCGGEVKDSDLSQEGGREGFQQYVKVPVKRPLSDRQTRAYYGDWILSASQGPAGFKVYTPKAFVDSFQRQVDEMIDTVQRMNERAAAEEKREEEDDIVDFDDLPGVHRTVNADPLQPFAKPGLH